MKKQISQALILFIVLVAAFAGGYIWLSQPLLKVREQVRLYDGDGQIRNRSYLYLFTPIASYEVSFEPFALDRPYSASYRLSGLPELRAKPLVYLNTIGIVKPADLGRIRVSISDGSGNVVQSLASEHTSELIWSQPSTAEIIAEIPDYDYAANSSSSTVSLPQDPIDGERYALYDPEQSQFEPLTTESYTLTIDYEPAATAQAGTGIISIRSAGKF